MTAIRVKSPPSEDETEQLLRQHTNSSNGSFQLEGVVSDTWTRSSRSKAEVGGRSESYPEHHRRNSLSELDRRERAASRISMPASLRSEPDLDTIMPLSGAEGGLTRTAALSGYEGEGQGEDEQDEDTPSFTTVEHHAVFGDDLTAAALQTCKKTVLHPYLLFLKMIGWRKFNPKRYDLRTPVWLTVLNVLWPTFVCLLLVFSCITQICTCFRRDHVALSPLKNVSVNESRYEVSCEQHILTVFIIPDILLVFSFAYGLYIFRWIHTEQLATLTEAVFLGHMNKYGKYSHKRLTATLQLVILLGVIWILYSLASSIGRAYILRLVDKDTDIQWISGTKRADLLRWVFVSITIVGFVLLDIAYTAVVVNYCIQCQLLIYLLRSITDRTRFKEWGLDRAIKEIRNSREFLSQLNSHLSRAISILLFIFLTSSMSAVYGVYRVEYADRSAQLVSLFGVLAAIQWLAILLLPLIQAARVTRACSSLKKVATEVRSRPYSYKDTSQLDLDSVVIFTSGLRMSAKLISIPISPSVVAGLLFFGGLALFMVFQYGSISWPKWL